MSVSGSVSVSNSVDRQVTIEEAFRHYDADNSGFLDAAELRELAEHLGAPLNGRDLKLALRVLDQDQSGVIECEEFVKWWSAREDGSQTDPAQQELQQTLRNLAARGKKQHHVDIHVAAWRGSMALVRQFLAADPDMASRRDETDLGDGFQPLHYAAYNGHTQICSALLDAGADANARTEAGCTPLFYAAQQHRLDAVRLLLEGGADVTITDNQYAYSPLDVAATACLDVFRPRCALPAAPSPPQCAVTSSAASAAALEWDYAAERRRDGMWVAPPSSFEVRVFAGDAVWGKLRTYFGTRSATVQGLEEGKVYSFAVRGITPLGKGAWSERSADLPVHPRAPPPSNLRVALATHERITFEWDPPAGEAAAALTGFVLRHRQLNEHGIAIAPSARLPVEEGTRATLRGLVPGGHYRASVACVTAAGIGRSTAVVVARTDESVAVSRRKLRQAGVDEALLDEHDPAWRTVFGMQSISQQQGKASTLAKSTAHQVRIPLPTAAQ